MTDLELQKFKTMSQQKYILNENEEFMNLYQALENEELGPCITLDDMQKLMNEIVSFYEFKYPEQLLIDIENSIADDKAFKISKLLDVKQLKYRLHNNYVQFLECYYDKYVGLEKHTDQGSDTLSIRIYEDGSIDDYCLDKLKECKYLNTTKDIYNIQDLYKTIKNEMTDINYEQLTMMILKHQYNLKLRNMFLELVSLQMFCSEKTNIKYGYARAKSFIREFNREYELNLSMDDIDKFMGNTPDITKIKRKKTNVNHKIN